MNGLKICPLCKSVPFVTKRRNVSCPNKNCLIFGSEIPRKGWQELPRFSINKEDASVILYKLVRLHDQSSEGPTSDVDNRYKKEFDQTKERIISLMTGSEE